MDPSTDPGVTAPPAEPAAPAAPATPAPTGSEPVTNPGTPGEQSVPFSRFQEVNDKAKVAEEDARQAREELEALRAQPSSSQGADDELDPEVEDLIRKGAKKLGLVSQAELDANNQQNQVRQDIADLTTNPPNPGIPYDNKAVMDYAKANNMPITSKAALRAAYREMNYDKIVEAQRQSAIESYKKAGSSGAEQPGSTGAVIPPEPELTGRTPKERAKERIRLARQKIT